MKKRLLPKDTPQANRVALMGGGIAAGGFILALVVAPLLTDSTGEVRKKRSPRAELAQVGEVEARDSALPTYTPPSEDRELTIPEAMDRANIRMVVQQLVLAAAQENQAFQTAMLRSLKEYGSQATPILRERLAEAKSPTVVNALNQALAQAR